MPQEGDAVEWDENQQGRVVPMHGTIVEIIGNMRYSVKEDGASIVHNLSLDRLRPDLRPAQWHPKPGDRVEWNEEERLKYGVVASDHSSIATPFGVTPINPEDDGQVLSVTVHVKTEKLRPNGNPREGVDDYHYVLKVLNSSMLAFEHLAHRRNKVLAQRQVKLCDRAAKRLIRQNTNAVLCATDGCRKEVIDPHRDHCSAHHK